MKMESTLGDLREWKIVDILDGGDSITVDSHVCKGSLTKSFLAVPVHCKDASMAAYPVTTIEFVSKVIYIYEG